MIAAEHERNPALFEDAKRRLVQLLAEARDLADVFLARIAERLDLRDRRDEIARIDDRDPEAGQSFAQPCNPERGRTHVHATPVAAKIEGHTDDVNRPGHLRRIPDLTRPLRG